MAANLAISSSLTVSIGLEEDEEEEGSECLARYRATIADLLDDDGKPCSTTFSEMLDDDDKNSSTTSSQMLDDDDSPAVPLSLNFSANMPS
ncbi:hypothetical protein DFQ27_008851 [Actinomortierella ambigua]|uniref:Uncharacterized protein n=1 Tax=Actinomortierella ambigua TaxID=1343610 RepID=A0A9P6PSQ2_9FUNG|nr:hypothetical protein DFQ27_008851 [Actinomortierella ambigua]